MCLKDTAPLSRYTRAHWWSYRTALGEIKRGRKASHWMWYIFPQVIGLGKSEESRRYAIQSLDEAEAFLRDPYLGGHLREISNALLDLPGDDPAAVFGSTDARKLRSCMTLFAYISEDGSVFHRVLEKYFRGRWDDETLAIIEPR